MLHLGGGNLTLKLVVGGEEGASSELASLWRVGEVHS